MKSHVKLALKLLSSYFITLLISVVFVLPFYEKMFAYSLVMFILMSLFIYSDMGEQAKKENKPYNNLKPYLFKGFVVGLIAIIPLVLIILISPYINIKTDLLKFDALKQLILNGLFIPIYFIVKLGGKTIPAYLLAVATLPLLSGIGYFSGHLGFSVMDFLYEKFGFRLPKPKKKKK